VSAGKADPTVQPPPTPAEQGAPPEQATRPEQGAPPELGVPESSLGVYAISVAAQLAGSGVAALRLYERRGLLAPDRTGGGTRRYSAQDVEAARRIGDLLADGVNLTGVARVIQLEAENASLRAELRALRANTTAGRGPQAGGRPVRT
jgi:MerR family transcriptional regulator/heat shock protein HspR